MIPESELVLLDTNVLVQLIRGNQVGQRIATEHSLGARAERPLISTVTVGEMKSLARKFRWGEDKVRRLDELLHQLVIVELGQGEISDRYAEIDHYTERIVKPARPIGQNDMWIAATASVAAAHLITTDSDFDHLSPKFIKLAKIDPRNGVALS